MARYHHNEAIQLEDGSITTIYDMSEEQLAQYDIQLIGPAKQQYNELHPKQQQEQQQQPVPANDVSVATSQDNDIENIQQNNTEDIKNDLESFVKEYKSSKINEYEEYVVPGEDGSLKFLLPDYGYEKYVTDVANWQKQRISFGAEPGYYYFKVFFNFSTNYGLLGGLMMTIDNAKTSGSMLASRNTAFGYLKTIRKYHQYENVNERILALAKFAATLKDISLRTPWLFKSISGLNTINSAYISNFDKEKNIIIGCGQESVDSRIGTLMDLYKYACFDSINCKEIIPANLRKFEMSIMVYHIPLNHYHNKVMTDKDNAKNVSIGSNIWRSISGQDAYGITNLDFDGQIEPKTTNDESNFSNMMSFKLFTFLNCEIDTENINEYYVDGMSNETAFQLGNNQIKIKYDRVYEHRMNEWAQMFFGSDGFYYNRGIPDIFREYSEYNEENDEIEYKTLSNIGSDVNFNITPDTMANESINSHEQRILALGKKWIGNMPSGKISVMDYQKLLLGKYYASVDTKIPKAFFSVPFSINDMMTTSNNIKKNYGNWKDNRQNWYENIFRR